MGKHWDRLKRSLGRRWREWRLPKGYERLGTRYGGWWIDTRLVGTKPLLIDCGLGEDISFPTAFLKRFPGAQVIGVDPNPRSLAYCQQHCPSGMEILDAAFWTTAGETVTFYLPRPQEMLPKGADGVSGSLESTHEYVEGGEKIEAVTESLDSVLARTGRSSCPILKLDIEGAEYTLIDSLIDSGRINVVHQLLVEFHHGVTSHTEADTQGTTIRLAAAGFCLIHSEGRNRIFRRNVA